MGPIPSTRYVSVPTTYVEPAPRVRAIAAPTSYVPAPTSYVRDIAIPSTRYVSAPTTYVEPTPSVRAIAAPTSYVPAPTSYVHDVAIPSTSYVPAPTTYAVQAVDRDLVLEEGEEKIVSEEYLRSQGRLVTAEPAREIIGVASPTTYVPDIAIPSTPYVPAPTTYVEPTP